MITKEQVSFSSTAIRKGINNKVTDLAFTNALKVDEHILQKVKEKFPNVHISSWYRSPILNKFIGGSPTSQHMEGKAIDLICTDNISLFHFIKDNLDFDQLIWEFGTDAPAWVHVSYNEGANRKQCLKAIKVKSQTRYIEWK